MTKHTPGPWETIHEPTLGTYRIIKQFDNTPYITIARITYAENLIKYQHEANAERIVHCVNHFDELVEALVNILTDYDEVTEGPSLVTRESIAQARAALAKAKGA